MWTLFLAVVAALTVQASESARLDIFVGKWRASVRAIGTGASESPAAGEANYRWDIGRRWLVYESTFDLPGGGRYEVNGTVGFDQSSKRYRAWAFNSLGVAIEYTGDWNDDVTLVFTSISSTARVTYTRRPDGSIRLLSERRVADGTFEAYFESVLTRPPS
jgi:hypothetical protein